jgi:predicted acyl esterase
MACLDPPGLAAMFLESGGFWDAYEDGVRRGGAFTLKQVTWAFKVRRCMHACWQHAYAHVHVCKLCGKGMTLC